MGRHGHGLGHRSTVIWKTDMENCGELSFSPNGEYVAYIRETNGVLEMDLKQALYALQNQGH